MISSDGDMADYFRFRFSSKYLDDETGLYNYGFSYYAPALRRWINQDPLNEFSFGIYFGIIEDLTKRAIDMNTRYWSG